MKIKYLSLEDRQNIRVLRHASDVTFKINILESVLRRPYYTLQALWEYRTWFLELTEEQLENHPFLVWGLTQILVLQGELSKAYQLMEQMPEGGVHQLNVRLTLPGVTFEEMHRIARELQTQKGLLDNYVLTAGRPSILNGAWDMTPYADLLLNHDEEMMETIRLMFPKQTQSIYELSQAEALYWRNDCYKALILIVSNIPLLKEAQDMRLLFTALTLEIYILVVNGQAVSIDALMKNLRQQLKDMELEAYLPNIDAMEAWAAMYDGDYAKVTRWLRSGAPDEYSKFCALDMFRYMVKMRVYIIQGKYLAVTSFGQRVLPMLEAGNRYMDMCELHIICAMSDYADEREENALEHIDKALELSRKYRYDRLFADEGWRVLKILKLYQKKYCGGEKDVYLEQLIDMTEKTAAIHPRYLKTQLPEQPALTDTEMRVLRLLADFKTNAEISEITGMAEETAKKHCKHIFSKLEVKNRYQAVEKAIEYGLIEPKKA